MPACQSASACLHLFYFNLLPLLLLLLLRLALKVGSSMLRQPLVLHLARAQRVAASMAARGVSCDRAIVGSLLPMLRSRQQSRAATACCLAWRVCRLWWVFVVWCVEFVNAASSTASTAASGKERVAGYVVVVVVLFFCRSCCTFLHAHVFVHIFVHVYVLWMHLFMHHAGYE